MNSQQTLWMKQHHLHLFLCSVLLRALKKFVWFQNCKTIDNLGDWNVFRDSVLTARKIPAVEIDCQICEGYILNATSASKVHISSTSISQSMPFTPKICSVLPYSPDLGPSDFHLFCYLKESLSGNCFTTDDKVKEAVTDCLSLQVSDYYDLSVQSLVELHDKNTNWKLCTKLEEDVTI